MNATIGVRAAHRLPFLMLQLFRFCIVGATSTVIHQGLLYVMLHSFGPQLWTLWTCISFVFGVANGFYWNRRWTFGQSGRDGGQKQFAKFLMTNIIGLGLNLLITKGFLILFLGHSDRPGAGEERIVQFASICAIPLVVIWNFSASRFWTFKTPKNLSETPISAQK